MLSRMYTRWIDIKILKKVLWISIPEMKQIKSVTIKVEGENAFGLLKSESGVHRLVRISPFDTQEAYKFSVFGSINSEQ